MGVFYRQPQISPSGSFTSGDVSKVPSKAGLLLGEPRNYYHVDGCHAGGVVMLTILLPMYISLRYPHMVG